MVMKALVLNSTQPWLKIANEGGFWKWHDNVMVPIIVLSTAEAVSNE